jgi:hypothetical protein
MSKSGQFTVRTPFPVAWRSAALAYASSALSNLVLATHPGDFAGIHVDAAYPAEPRCLVEELHEIEFDPRVQMTGDCNLPSAFRQGFEARFKQWSANRIENDINSFSRSDLLDFICQVRVLCTNRYVCS